MRAVRADHGPSLFPTYTGGISWQLCLLCGVPRCGPGMVWTGRYAAAGCRAGGSLLRFVGAFARVAHCPVPRLGRFDVAVWLAARADLSESGSFPPPAFCWG